MNWRADIYFVGALKNNPNKDAVNSMREDIGINPLIELVPIIRNYSEEGWNDMQQCHQ